MARRPGQTLQALNRRDAGQRELTTAQVMDEICEYMTCQCAVYIGGHFILQGGKAR
ncbi:hypothetical protein [Klebsiella pneumoniae]|uniref:hypothetical protein n=1 Tax=Klebsiella pneumoniae TaxID=573 RepID=UPI001F606CCF|nr:hypothetical protein [Klebsiella pneumoniae]UNS83816.1 hypothetical protein MOQ79_29325 [Klebsiella pneumoniae]